MKTILNNIILVINVGSSSIKFGLFTRTKSAITLLCGGAVNGIGSRPKLTIKQCPNFTIESTALINHQYDDVKSFPEAYQHLIDWIVSEINGESIRTVCYRVVHGGDSFDSPAEITTNILDVIESLIPLAPLHQPMGLLAIKQFMKQFPSSRHFACFDTAFHRSMPKVSQMFALPHCLTKQGIKPYGFHGLSYQYIAEKMKQLSEMNFPQRVVVAHLGSGASVCALKNGKSIATSMSFSPLDGLPMATRCGSLDASVVLFMIEHLNYSTDEISDILNKKSGLLGLSNLSGDVQVLLNSDSEDAIFSVDFYINKICREIAAMTASLEGIDALVFTGGIGANNHEVRKRVCNKLDWLGCSIDSNANSKNDDIISNASSNFVVYSIETNEELMMAELVSGARQ